MTVPVDFLIGFSCCGIVAALYLLYEFIELFREFLSILREILEDE